jgi:hypothetical protein|tara:strand:- start:1643 stop:2926 length:1284 start_codon:yes stop_codon:yes gene_type:complete
MSLNDQIKKHLLANQHLMCSKYADTAKKFGTNYEQIRNIARRLRSKNPSVEPGEKEVINFQEIKDEAILTAENCTRVKSLKDLLASCKVDLDEWEVDKYDIGTYEVTGFDNDRKPITVTMFRTKAWLKRIKPELNLKQIKEQLIEDLRNLSPRVLKIKRERPNDRNDLHLLEISAFDLHLGKIGIKGDEYNLDIAEERLFSAIEHLLYRAQGYYIDKILFIVGNDLLNSDGDWPIPTTTKGTPQFNNEYHINMYRTARRLMIKAIDMLSEIADIHVMVVPGNHDRESVMHLGDCLQLYYENNENIKVDNNDCLMKALPYGNNLIVSDHGDGPKTADLPGIISQRFKNMWSNVDYVEIHRGHFHTNKAMKLQAIEELNGITVRNLSSMSATDYWHDAKGFIGNIKKAQAFIYSRQNGLQGILNYNVKV